MLKFVNVSNVCPTFFCIFVITIFFISDFQDEESLTLFKERVTFKDKIDAWRGEPDNDNLQSVSFTYVQS